MVPLMIQLRNVIQEYQEANFIPTSATAPPTALESPERLEPMADTRGVTVAESRSPKWSPNRKKMRLPNTMKSTESSTNATSTAKMNRDNSPDRDEK